MITESMKKERSPYISPSAIARGNVREMTNPETSKNLHDLFGNIWGSMKSQSNPITEESDIIAPTIKFE